MVHEANTKGKLWSCVPETTPKNRRQIMSKFSRKNCKCSGKPMYGDIRKRNTLTNTTFFELTKLHASKVVVDRSDFWPLIHYTS